MRISWICWFKNPQRGKWQTQNDKIQIWDGTLTQKQPYIKESKVLDLT
jgi:hypothetical protein